MSKEETIKRIIQRFRNSNLARGVVKDEDYISTLLYLSDWKSCLEHRKPVTSIKWIHGDNGPQANIDISRLIDSKIEIFSIKESIKDFFEIFLQRRKYHLKDDEEEILSLLIDSLDKKSMQEIFRIANSTYPMITTGKKDELKLKNLSQRYKHKLSRRIFSPEIVEDSDEE